MTTADDQTGPTGPAANAGVRAVSRALSVLALFSRGESQLSIAEISKGTGLPRTTALRLVETLVDEQMLFGAAGGKFRPGVRLLNWGALADVAWSLPAATSARLQLLARDTGETVSLYVRSGLDRVCVGQASGPQTLRHVVQVGDTLPLWGGAAAVVLLGLETDEIRGPLLRELEAQTNGAVTAATLGQRVLESVAAGFSVTHGDREKGNSGVAVPVIREDNPRRVATGAAPARATVLAVGGPTERITADRIPAIVDAARECAFDILRTGLPPAMR